jgi:hypothetical protein
MGKRNLERITEALIKRQIDFLLKEAKETDYFACPFKANNFLRSIARRLGYDYVKSECSLCKAKIERLNVKTKAKPICPICFQKIVEEPNEIGVGGKVGDVNGSGSRRESKKTSKKKEKDTVSKVRNRKSG